MFGNRLGWGISAVLALCTLGLFWMLAGLNAVSPPSTGVVSRTGNVALNLAKNPQKLDPLVLPFNVAAILPNMTDPASPAPIYQEAIADYKAHPDTYTAHPPANLTSLKGFDALIRARVCRPSVVFAPRETFIIGYEIGSSKPLEDVRALFDVGKSASRAALSAQPSQEADALLLAEAVFSLGAKLFDERLRYEEMTDGAELMRDGAYLIAKFDPSRAQAVAGVDPALKQLLADRCVPLWTVISSVDPGVVGRTAGDIFYIAKHSRERLWQIEATLKLGRLKHDQGEGGRGGDGRAAALAAKRMANDDALDPAVRTAAQRAVDLTVEQHRMLGG
jgi:hypothetical protein